MEFITVNTDKAHAGRKRCQKENYYARFSLNFSSKANEKENKFFFLDSERERYWGERRENLKKH